MIFFFGITVLLYQNKNPVDHMIDRKQFCASLMNPFRFITLMHVKTSRLNFTTSTSVEFHFYHFTLLTDEEMSHRTVNILYFCTVRVQKYSFHFNSSNLKMTQSPNKVDMSSWYGSTVFPTVVTGTGPVSSFGVVSCVGPPKKNRSRVVSLLDPLQKTSCGSFVGPPQKTPVWGRSL